MTSIAEGEAELQGYGGSCAVTWPCGLMDKALVFGTKDCRFESCQGHLCLATLSFAVGMQSPPQPLRLEQLIDSHRPGPL